MNFTESKGKDSIGISLTPMVDVLFILLIFVLVSTTFLEQPALNIELPNAKSAGLERIEEIVISVSKDNEIYFNQKIVEKEDLPQMLKEEMMKNQEMPVIFKADKEVSYGLVIEVMDIMRGVGVKKLVALTQYGLSTGVNE